MRNTEYYINILRIPYDALHTLLYEQEVKRRSMRP